MRSMAWLGVALWSGTVACGDDPPEEWRSGTLHLVWAACPWDSAGGVSDAECATVRAPLDWSGARGGSIDLFVKRLPAVATSRGQLWLLAGGPGVDGSFFESLRGLLQWAAPDLDLYVPDHRGTGRSTRLGCAAEEAENGPGGIEVTGGEIASCIAAMTGAWGDRLEELRPTQAARDVRALIDAAASPGEAVFVYGRSYGTYLLHRYLQVAPTQADGVIFDSICGPRECRFPIPFDLGHAEMGERLLDLCAADASCSSRLPDPAGALAAALDELDQGGCAQLGWNRDSARRTLGFMMRDAGVRSYLPAAVYRLQRCHAADVSALQHLVGRLFGVPAPAPPTYALRSLMLRDHILLSELWQEPTPAELDLEQAALFTGGAVQDFPWLHPQWPRYGVDPLTAGTAATSIPVLMLQGGLDPQTTPTLAVSLRAALDGATQYYVEVPLSTHGIINSAFLPGVAGHTCGTDLISQFLADPMTAPDDACAALAAPLDFAGTAAGAQSLFGTDHPWD